ncbi:hypothetical protein M426DRAFT_89003 [Hypoxylon sp. CI-4A]|nr:hypothetical protein M426DRAFT_89003 [Hypoxylon sp. CI-4A]
MAPYSRSTKLATAVLAVNSVGLVLSFISTLLRFWARYIRRVKWRLSDSMIIASWLFTLGLVISENYCVTHGGIGHEAATPNELLFTAKQFLVIDVCGSLAVAFVKISILDFLLSVFSSNVRFRIAAYILMGLSAGYGFSFAVASLAACTPFAANWDKVSYPDAKCINTSHFYIAQAGIGVTLDCLILALPIPLVWALSLRTSKKVGLTILFTIGILICVISITRLAYNTQEEWMAAHFTEYGAIASIVGGLEANLSIVCACLPCMSPLFTTFAGKVKSSIDSHGGVKGLYNNVSSRYRRPTRGSTKLSDGVSVRPANSFIEDDMESARLQKQVDKLYPLNTTIASRVSIEAEEGWAPRTRGTSFTHVASASTVVGEDVLEMARLGDKVEPYSAINVTKTWGVNQN